MSNYTKGPWAVSELDYELEVLSSDNIFICSTPNIDPDNTGFNVCNETAANMDLITAAPDLLEALEAIKADLLERANLDSDNMKVVDCGASVWIQVHCAIAKAKGELK